MRLFEVENQGNFKTVKIFGKELYSENRYYKRRVQKYLGKIFSTIKIDEENFSTKVIRFFKFAVARKIVSDDYEKEYIGNHLVKSVDLKQQFIKKYGRYINGYSDVFIFNANSGEICLFLTYILQSFLRKNDCKKPLLVATKKYHLDLIDILCPQIPHVYIKKIRPFRSFVNKIGEQRFYTVFKPDYFYGVEKAIKTGPLGAAHYFHSILGHMKMTSEDLEFQTAVVPKAVQDSMLEKVVQSGLNLDNFVFIAPEAASCEEYDDSFWVDLSNCLKAKGMDVFMNFANPDKDTINCEYKSCSLTFSEAFALAKLSKGIVSLRSGLTEFLLQTNVPLSCLYTKFRKRPIFNEMAVERVLSGFCLTKIPGVSPEMVQEFNMVDESNENVIKQILDFFVDGVRRPVSF